MPDSTLPATSLTGRIISGAWLRFRLRSLLIFITLCTLPLSWAAWRLTSYRRQAQALSHLTQLANRDLASPAHATMEPGTPSWLARFAEQGQFRSIVELTINNTKELTDAEAVHLGHFSQLRKLSMDGAGVTNRGLRHLSQLGKLQELSLEKTAVGDAGLQHLASLPELRHLDLNDTQVTGNGMKWLVGLPRLEKLQLKNCQITDEGLVHLAQVSSLKELLLVNSQVTGKGLKLLHVLPHLQVLDVKGELLQELDFIGFPALESLKISGPQTTRVVVSDCPQLTFLRADHYYDDQSCMEISLQSLPAMQEIAFLTTRPRVLRIADLTGLKKLNLENQDLDVLELSRVPSLRSVNLHGALVVSDLLRTIADAAPRLTSINLGDTHHPPTRPPDRKPVSLRDRSHSLTRLTATSLQPLADLPDLTSLTLTRTAADDSTMLLLRDHHNLKFLSIASTAVSNEGLRHLQELANLDTLRLSNTQVGDDGLAHLSNLTNLRLLVLDQTKISNAGLQHLGCLQQLQYLEVKGTNVTSEGATALRSRMPNCEIDP